MKINNVAGVAAYSAGSNLWITADSLSNDWCIRIDWALNFQLTRLQSRRAKDLSDDVKTLLRENEIEFGENLIAKDAAKVVVSLGRLPCDVLVEIDFSGDSFGKWVSTCRDLWKGFGKPSARVFLPRQKSHKDFENHWNVSDSDVTVGVVAVAPPDLLAGS